MVCYHCFIGMHMICSFMTNTSCRVTCIPSFQCPFSWMSLSPCLWLALPLFLGSRFSSSIWSNSCVFLREHPGPQLIGEVNLINPGGIWIYYLFCQVILSIPQSWPLFPFLISCRPQTLWNQELYVLSQYPQHFM